MLIYFLAGGLKFLGLGLTTINDAFADAAQKKHKFVTLEHLLLALLDNPDANQLLLNLDVNIQNLKSGILIYIQEKLSEKCLDPIKCLICKKNLLISQNYG